MFDGPYRKSVFDSWFLVASVKSHGALLMAINGTLARKSRSRRIGSIVVLAEQLGFDVPSGANSTPNVGAFLRMSSTETLYDYFEAMSA